MLRGSPTRPHANRGDDGCNAMVEKRSEVSKQGTDVGEWKGDLDRGGSRCHAVAGCEL